MDNKQLLEKLNRMGFPLLEVTEAFDVNKVLAEVIETEDVRYWEGFPVVLANAAKEGLVDYAKAESYLTKQNLKGHLKVLFLLSLVLYKLNGLEFDWVRQYRGALSQKDKDALKNFMSYFRADAEFDVMGYRFSPDRMKKVFLNYFTLEASETKTMLDRSNELSLEFALSQVFSPRQKELFKKKLKGELLTKTGREYFSRSVKKTVMALANPELHRLAQKVAGL